MSDEDNKLDKKEGLYSKSDKSEDNFDLDKFGTEWENNEDEDEFDKIFDNLDVDNPNIEDINNYQLLPSEADSSTSGVMFDIFDSSINVEYAKLYNNSDRDYYIEYMAHV